MAKLRALCAEQKMPIYVLERKANIGNGVIARWAWSQPRIGNLQAVANVLGVTVDDLLLDAPDTGPGT